MTPHRAVVEKEKQLSPGAAGDLSLFSAPRDGSLETEGEEQWAQMVALLNPSFARDLVRAEQDKTAI